MSVFTQSLNVAFWAFLTATDEEKIHIVKKIKRQIIPPENTDVLILLDNSFVVKQLRPLKYARLFFFAIITNIPATDQNSKNVPIIPLIISIPILFNELISVTPAVTL